MSYPPPGGWVPRRHPHGSRPEHYPHLSDEAADQAARAWRRERLMNPVAPRWDPTLPVVWLDRFYRMTDEDPRLDHVDPALEFPPGISPLPPLPSRTQFSRPVTFVNHNSMTQNGLRNGTSSPPPPPPPTGPPVGPPPRRPIPPVPTRHRSGGGHLFSHEYEPGLAPQSLSARPYLDASTLPPIRPRRPLVLPPINPNRVPTLPPALPRTPLGRPPPHVFPRSPHPRHVHFSEGQGSIQHNDPTRRYPRPPTPPSRSADSIPPVPPVPRRFRFVNSQIPPPRPVPETIDQVQGQPIYVVPWPRPPPVLPVIEIHLSDDEEEEDIYSAN
ncbi:hypothetical protein AK830_g12540 [Neonectria ditissima]|uniref:Uncharacterized protein n=1 Tax=Neonectria ditissima TaxID=78410 RepID=A0A0P7B579_9HYPO|nr:hypothetical protein AK830_g12540 [Neonectria ditissima]